MWVWLFSCLIILVFSLDKIMKKWLGIDKEIKISETAGKRIDRYGRVIIFFISIGLIPVYITQEASVMKWYLMLIFTLSFGFQAILEWKYLKGSKQYIKTIMFLILGVFLIYHIEEISDLLN